MNILGQMIERMDWCVEKHSQQELFLINPIVSIRLSRSRIVNPFQTFVLSMTLELRSLTNFYNFPFYFYNCQAPCTFWSFIFKNGQRRTVKSLFNQEPFFGLIWKVWCPKCLIFLSCLYDCLIVFFLKTK